MLGVSIVISHVIWFDWSASARNCRCWISLENGFLHCLTSWQSTAKRVNANSRCTTTVGSLWHVHRALCGRLAGPRLDERDVHVAADQGTVCRVERHDRRTNSGDPCSTSSPERRNYYYMYLRSVHHNDQTLHQMRRRKQWLRGKAVQRLRKPHLLRSRIAETVCDGCPDPRCCVSRIPSQ